MADTDEPRWTPMRGMIRAARTLSIRAIIVVFVWGFVLWLLTPWFNTLETRGAAQGGRWVGILALPALTVGWFMSWRLIEAAGFRGWPVTALAVVFTLAAVLGGAFAAALLRPLGQTQTIGVLFVMGIVPVGWVWWKTAVDH